MASIFFTAKSAENPRIHGHNNSSANAEALAAIWRKQTFPWPRTLFTPLRYLLFIPAVLCVSTLSCAGLGFVIDGSRV